MSARLNRPRRRFLQTSAGVASGLALGFFVPAGVRAALLGESQPPPGGPAKLPDANAFLVIGADDIVTIRLAHSEMGQGIWTTLAMLVAEELECDWSKVRVEHAVASPTYAHLLFGIMGTGGSTTTWSEFDRYRQVGAVARDLLIRAAAVRWKVAPSTCRAENGFVISGANRLSFGAVAADAQKLAPPAEVTLKPASAWKIIGKPTRRLDSPEKVSGRAQFGMDVRFPGLMTAVIERGPVFGATVKRVNSEKALSVPGVKKVVQVPSGVAVIAEHFWAAQQGRAALDVDWDEGPGAQVDSASLLAEYRALVRQPGAKAASAGDAAGALAKASKVVEAEFDGPFLSHASMEPLNCTVRLSADKCEIWTGTQFQGIDQPATAKVAGLKPEQVEIHTMFLGGGFGRRASPNADFVLEAVHVAKAAGVPVKVVWSREDDMRGGYYRPMFVHRARVGLDASGAPVAWHHAVACQSIMEGTPFAAMIQNGIDSSSVEGTSDSPYMKGTPNHLVELHSPKSAVPVLWWRSVGHTHTAFVMESLVDELAHAAGRDPLDYRRALLKEHPRHLGVLNLAAGKAGWGTPLPAGRFRGLAVHESFGSYVAQVAEVSVDAKGIHVHRVVCAVDCGTCVNPSGVSAQMQSGIVYGLSAALHGAITLKNGRVQQSNFHDYEVLRLAAMPKVEVHIVPSREKSGGAGEPGTPTIAPAVANAIFAATGKRLRSLPFTLA